MENKQTKTREAFLNKIKADGVSIIEGSSFDRSENENIINSDIPFGGDMWEYGYAMDNLYSGFERFYSQGKKPPEKDFDTGRKIYETFQEAVEMQFPKKDGGHYSEEEMIEWEAVFERYEKEGHVPDPYNYGYYHFDADVGSKKVLTQIMELQTGEPYVLAELKGINQGEEVIAVIPENLYSDEYVKSLEAEYWKSGGAKSIATNFVLEKLEAAGIEVVADRGAMREILESGKLVQKMAAFHGTGGAEKSFDGYGAYVVSVDEGDARRVGMKVASKKYGDAFYVKDQTFETFLKEHKFSPYWAELLKQSRLDNVEELQTAMMLSDTKGNAELERQKNELSTLFKYGLVEHKREKAFVYSIDIPDNDGKNYLPYESPIGLENAEKINGALEKLGTQWRVTRNDGGRQVYFNTLSEKVFNGSQEEASKFLKDAGFVGMRMNEKNYIILDEKDINVNKRVQFMTDKNGEIYGFAHGGKVYLDPDLMNANTPAHEYTHLWDAYTRQTNPELWERGKAIFAGTRLWEEVVDDPNYADIADDEDLVLSEVHARICGDIAQRVLERMAEQDGEIARDRAIDWDKEVAEYVAGELGAEFPKPELGSESYVSDSVRQEIAREFLSRPMRDLTEGKQIARNIPFQNIIQKMAEEHAFPDAGEYFKFNRIDSENFRKALDNFDGLNPLQLIKVGEIPPVMKALGISDNPIEMPQSVVSKALREEAVYPNDKKGHALTMEHIRRIPESLADPIMVFKSRTRDDSYVFLTEQKDNSNRSIIIPVAVDKRYGRLVINEITSIYGRTNEVDFVKTNIEQGNLVYADKKRSLDWERECQVQFLAQVLPSEGSYSSILTKENLVKFVSSVSKEKIQKMAMPVENGNDAAAPIQTQADGAAPSRGLSDAWGRNFTAPSYWTHDDIEQWKELAQSHDMEVVSLLEFTYHAAKIIGGEAELDSINNLEELALPERIESMEQLVAEEKESRRTAYEHLRGGLSPDSAAERHETEALSDGKIGSSAAEESVAAERLRRAAEVDYDDPIEAAEAWHNGTDEDREAISRAHAARLRNAPSGDDFVRITAESADAGLFADMRNEMGDDPLARNTPETLSVLRNIESLAAEAGSGAETERLAKEFVASLEESGIRLYKSGQKNLLRILDIRNVASESRDIPDAVPVGEAGSFFWNGHNVRTDGGKSSYDLIAEAHGTAYRRFHAKEAMRKILENGNDYELTEADTARIAAAGFRNRESLGDIGRLAAEIGKVELFQKISGAAFRREESGEKTETENEYDFRDKIESAIVADNKIGAKYRETFDLDDRLGVKGLDDIRVEMLQKIMEQVGGGERDVSESEVANIAQGMLDGGYAEKASKAKRWEFAEKEEFIDPVRVMAMDTLGVDAAIEIFGTVDRPKEVPHELQEEVRSLSSSLRLQGFGARPTLQDIEKIKELAGLSEKTSARYVDEFHSAEQNSVIVGWKEIEDSAPASERDIPDRGAGGTEKIFTMFYGAERKPHYPEQVVSVLKEFAGIDNEKWNVPPEAKPAVFHLIEVAEVNGGDFQKSVEKFSRYLEGEEYAREEENYAKILEPILMTEIPNFKSYDGSKGEFVPSEFAYDFSTGESVSIRDLGLTGDDFVNTEAGPAEISGEIKSAAGNEFSGGNRNVAREFQKKLVAAGIAKPDEEFVLVNELEAHAKGTKVRESAENDFIILNVPVEIDGKKEFVQTKYYHVSALEEPQNVARFAESKKEEPKERTVEVKNENGQTTKIKIEFGKTKVPEFAMVTQNGLQSYNKMTVASYEKNTDSYLLVSENKSQQLRVQSSTMISLLSDEKQKEIEKVNTQIEENKELGKSTENLEFKKEKLEQGMSVAQYNDFFQTRENCANNFRHNLSVMCRKEANSPLDALKIANKIITQMSESEKVKTRDLLNLLKKDGRTTNEVLIDAYNEAVKETPLNEQYLLRERYDKMIARPMYDTVSGKGEKIDEHFNLKVGDTVKMAFNMDKNLAFEGTKLESEKRAFSKKEGIFSECKIISSSKEGNVVTLMDGDKSFYDVPRDTFLKEYARSEKVEKKQERKESRKKSVMRIDIER